MCVPEHNIISLVICMFPEHIIGLGLGLGLAKHFPEKVASTEHITLRGNIYHYGYMFGKHISLVI